MNKFIIWLVLTTGNFVWNDVHKAFELSYYQGFALLTVWLYDKIFPEKAVDNQ